MIKIGDKVKVVQHPSGNNEFYDDSEGFNNCWVDEMNDDIGKEFTIQDITRNGVLFKERIDPTDYTFPPTALIVL